MRNISPCRKTLGAWRKNERVRAVK